MSSPTHTATTVSAPFAVQAPPELDHGAATADLTLTGELDEPWRGFGACFNELGWVALSKLDTAEREQVLDRLFDPTGEARFNFCRLPIGANDYSLGWYSLADTPNDFEMRHFSIKRDRHCLIPYIQAALRRFPELTLFASPWSPPVWMKRPAIYNGGRFIQEQCYWEAYARYFLRFVEEYAAEGIRIAQVHVQNEPVSRQPFPSCVMSGEEFRIFIGKYLGPLFEKNGCETEIWLGTLNGPETDERKFRSGFNEYANAVLLDPDAGKYTKGVSYQWAGKYALHRTRLAFPNVPLIQSENECGEGANSWEHAWYVADLLHHYLSHGVIGYVYWNSVLEPKGESTWGWRQNSLFTVDPQRGAISANPEYHIMRHYSAFVKRGDRRETCASPWAGNAVAFRREEDHSAAVIVRNPFAGGRSIRIADGSRRWRVQLSPESLNTVILS